MFLKGPQFVFFGLILAFTFLVLGQSLAWDYATALSPRIMEIGMLALMVPIGIDMLRRKTAHTMFFDTERELVGGAGVEQRSSEHYLLWLVGMLGVAALTGFVIAVAAFLYVFLRVKAHLTRLMAVLGAAAFVALLATMSHFLTLEYPQGLLQDYITLPWPLS